MKALVAVTALVVLFSAFVYLGILLPASLVELNSPLIGRHGVVIHDTTFYPGTDIQAIMEALSARQLLRNAGGLCDQGITRGWRQIVKAGTHVQVVKEITVQSKCLNVTFAHVHVGASDGWVTANAVQ